MQSSGMSGRIPGFPCRCGRPWILKSVSIQSHRFGRLPSSRVSASWKAIFPLQTLIAVAVKQDSYLYRFCLCTLNEYKCCQMSIETLLTGFLLHKRKWRGFPLSQAIGSFRNIPYKQSGNPMNGNTIHNIGTAQGENALASQIYNCTNLSEGGES